MQVNRSKIEVEARDVSSICSPLINPIFSRGENKMTSETISKVCSVQGCTNKHAAKSFCSTHYGRWKAHGNPLTVFKRWLRGDTPEERFWAGVKIADSHDDCWFWIGHKTDRGYGTIQFEGKNRRTHVVAWAITNGRYPSKFILHSCDNPPCCNPSHLREGTHDENMADKLERGRQPRGGQHGLAKATEEIVRDIRRRYVPGRQKPNLNTCEALGKEHGLSRAATWSIITRATWNHVE